MFGFETLFDILVSETPWLSALKIRVYTRDFELSAASERASHLRVPWRSACRSVRHLAWSWRRRRRRPWRSIRIRQSAQGKSLGDRRKDEERCREDREGVAAERSPGSGREA